MRTRAVLLPGLTASVLLGGLAVAPGAHAEETVSVTGPATVVRGGTVTLTGSAGPDSTVQVWFAKQGSSDYSVGRTVTAEDDGSFTTQFPARVDYSYYAVADGLTSSTSTTEAVGTTEVAPALVHKGSTVTLTGTARPGTTVHVFFRGAGQSAFANSRNASPDSNGSWSTTFTPTKDYRTYAETTEASSAQRLTQVQYATISGPSTAAKGSVVTLRGTARAGTAVTVYFRKSGTSAYVHRRSVTASRAGAFTTTYTADASYAYYAVSEQVRSAITSTNVKTAAAPQPKPAPSPKPAPTSSVPADPGNNKNCSDFSDWDQANSYYQYYYPYYGDVSRLDGDNDGIPCEDLPGAP